VLFEKTDPVGWSVKAELQAKGNVASGTCNYFVT